MSLSPPAPCPPVPSALASLLEIFRDFGWLRLLWKQLSPQLPFEALRGYSHSRTHLQPHISCEALSVFPIFSPISSPTSHNFKDFFPFLVPISWSTPPYSAVTRSHQSHPKPPICHGLGRTQPRRFQHLPRPSDAAGIWGSQGAAALCSVCSGNRGGFVPSHIQAAPLNLLSRGIRGGDNHCLCGHSRDPFGHRSGVTALSRCGCPVPELPSPGSRPAVPSRGSHPRGPVPRCPPSPLTRAAE